MFRILDRYVLRQVLLPFAIVLLVFTFVLEMPPIMEVADKFVAKGVAWSTVLRIIATLLPQALALTIPMGLLVGFLIGFGRLSEDREWVVMQACGISLYRMLRPVGLVAVAGTMATAYIIMITVPAANQAYREIAWNVVASRADSEVKPHVFFEDFPQQVLYIRDVEPGVRGWFDVFLADTRQPGQPVVYTARRGHVQVDRAKRTVDMVLEDGASHTVSGDTYQVNRFDNLRFSLDPTSVFPVAPQKGLSEMTIAELRAQAEDLVQQHRSPHGPLIRIQQKYAIPVACLVFGVAALALGLSSRKDGKFASFALGLGVIFVYYIFMYTGEAMAKGQAVPAWFGVWLANLVLGPAAVALLFYRARAGDRGLQVPLPFRRLKPAAPDEAQPPAARGGRAAARRPGGPVRVVVRIPRLVLPRPSVLDIYIGRLYVRVFAMAFFGLLGLFYIATFIDMSERVFKGTSTVGMLLRYCAYSTPQYVYFVIPIGALVSTLVTLGLLSRNSELVVMKACGISLYRTAVPMLVFAVLWSGVLFGLEERVMPNANRQADELRHVMVGNPPRTFDVLNRRWIVGKDGRIYNYEYFDPRRNELNRLSIYEFDPKTWELARRTFCTQAAWAPGPAGAPTWAARDGWVREFRLAGGGVARAATGLGGAAGVEPRYAPFTQASLQLERPDYFGTEEPDADRMNYAVLRRYIEELQSGGFNVVRYTVRLYGKIAFPFVTLVMTLLAVPFAVTMGRRGAMYGVGIGIVLAMVYWVSSQVFAAIGSGGLLDPLLAAWAPNLLFGASAAYLLLTART